MHKLVSESAITPCSNAFRHGLVVSSLQCTQLKVTMSGYSTSSAWKLLKVLFFCDSLMLTCPNAQGRARAGEKGSGDVL